VGARREQPVFPELQSSLLDLIDSADRDGVEAPIVLLDPALLPQVPEVELQVLPGVTEQALEIIQSHDDLAHRFQHLISVKGIGKTSAVRLLSELSVLPSDMTCRQWVAHAGLDPRHEQSGTSISKPPRISKVGNRHIRAALYMPALVAIQHEPNVAAFYDALIARGKKPKQAVVAVMRKLLHSIYGMLHHNEDFEGTKFYAISA